MRCLLSLVSWQHSDTTVIWKGSIQKLWQWELWAFVWTFNWQRGSTIIWEYLVITQQSILRVLYTKEDPKSRQCLTHFRSASMRLFLMVSLSTRSMWMCTFTISLFSSTKEGQHGGATAPPILKQEGHSLPTNSSIYSCITVHLHFISCSAVVTHAH